MQQKPDVTPRTATGIPAEIIHIPAIAESKCLLDDATHLRMDPRIQSRIHDVVSVLQRDYVGVLAHQINKLQKECQSWAEGDCAAEGQTYALAHEIRSIAGTFARPLASEIAARICSLIDTLDIDHCAPTIAIVHEHIKVLMHIVELTPEPQGMSAKVIINRLEEIAAAHMPFDHHVGQRQGMR
ncbi:MAG: hypothetical protein RLN89_01575 [Parvibaculum sp.]